MTVIALIVAAGRGERAGGGRPKQYRRLAGRPVLQHAIDAFLGHPGIDRVVAVIGAGDADLFAAEIRADDRLTAVTGGETRQVSVRRGLEACEADGPDRVLIHDGARPLVSRALIDRVLAATDDGRGAVPGLAVTDSLARRDGDGLLDERVARTGLMRLQTPQGFPFGTILAAHRERPDAAAGDDSALARAAGLPVVAVAGEERNLKITTAPDFKKAEAMLAQTLETRTGFGFDVHRFGPGDRVMLGGVAIPHERGLEGHSDADVALHALTDAILGALAEGDIGQHFPPGEATWRDADSSRFLAFAGDRVAARGGVLRHLDLTIVAQRPRIGPHREAIRARIADILGVSVERVSVKATTTEGLGFTGRGEGIAAQAVATVALPAMAEGENDADTATDAD